MVAPGSRPPARRLLPAGLETGTHLARLRGNGRRTDGKPHVLVFETKGEHLRGNPDTDYKQRVLETLQNAFNCGTMTVRDGPTKGTFRLVFNEAEFPTALAGLNQAYNA